MPNAARRSCTDRRHAGRHRERATRRSAANRGLRQRLEDKPEVVALNKIDAIPKAALAKKKASLEKACGHEVLLVSGVSGQGVDAVLRALTKEIKRKSRAQAEERGAAQWAR
jgi:GTPase involved in cell partitioning and DNA repair